ncbi:PepSY domain-containing protein [Pseudomonas sp. NPDC089422]|uniref:PepSY domain-containing protein n=1 Tax=Pseudomonas sp. NPDC089422 TaxID=3364466 RepID=UPI00380AC9F7
MRLSPCVLFSLSPLLLASGSTFAATQCTMVDKSIWQDPKKFQAELKDQGYKINKFKVTKGNCYEIYGFNKDGKKVEIYHDPVTGKAVKSEVEGY